MQLNKKDSYNQHKGRAEGKVDYNKGLDQIAKKHEIERKRQKFEQYEHQPEKSKPIAESEKKG